jgi:hypothetical protein
VFLWNSYIKLAVMGDLFFIFHSFLHLIGGAFISMALWQSNNYQKNNFHPSNTPIN